MNRAKWKTLLYILKAHDSTGSSRVGFVRGSVWSVLPTWSAVTISPPKADFNLDSFYAARKAYEDRTKRGWLR